MERVERQMRNHLEKLFVYDVWREWDVDIRDEFVAHTPAVCLETSGHIDCWQGNVEGPHVETGWKILVCGKSRGKSPTL